MHHLVALHVQRTGWLVGQLCSFSSCLTDCRDPPSEQWGNEGLQSHQIAQVGPATEPKQDEGEQTEATGIAGCNVDQLADVTEQPYAALPAGVFASYGLRF